MTVTATADRVTTAVPARYATTISHTRQTPLRHAFRYRSHCWLVDLDQLPQLPRGLRGLLQFRAEDHVGSGPTLRHSVDALLAAEGLSASRVLMLSNARVLGHVFNPISVHWCFDDAGDVVAVVAEVHNTYGGRHAYVLRVDDRMRARTDKVFYVSPFHQVDGHYEMRLPVPGAELRLDVTYHRPGTRPFVATVRGTRAPAGTSLLRSALRHPLSTRLVSLRIRVQGIRLYLRRLPVVPRHPQEQTR